MLTALPSYPISEFTKSLYMTSSAIGIIGLGYVGLPLSLQFARTGSTVLGFDIDSAKIKALDAGETYILHISSEAVRAQRDAGRFSATTDFSRVRECEAIIICVPTPLNKNREPDISYILDTGRAWHCKNIELREIARVDGLVRTQQKGRRSSHLRPDLRHQDGILRVGEIVAPFGPIAIILPAEVDSDHLGAATPTRRQGVLDLLADRPGRQQDMTQLVPPRAQVGDGRRMRPARQKDRRKRCGKSSFVPILVAPVFGDANPHQRPKPRREQPQAAENAPHDP